MLEFGDVFTPTFNVGTIGTIDQNEELPAGANQITTDFDSRSQPPEPHLTYTYIGDPRFKSNRVTEAHYRYVDHYDPEMDNNDDPSTNKVKPIIYSDYDFSGMEDKDDPYYTYKENGVLKTVRKSDMSSNPYEWGYNKQGKIAPPYAYDFPDENGNYLYSGSPREKTDWEKFKHDPLDYAVDKSGIRSFLKKPIFGGK